MMNLPVGANLPLTGNRWTVAVTFPHDIRHDLGLAVLPVNEAKQLVTSPQLAHTNATEWASAKLNDAGTSYSLTLDASALANPNITRL